MKTLKIMAIKKDKGHIRDKERQRVRQSKTKRNKARVRDADG